MNNKNLIVNIIGAGLAGCEAAYFLAEKGVSVKLFEMKPEFKSAAHRSENFCELVCSNSLKSEEQDTASGLLKKELEKLNCFVLNVAKETRVNAGESLSVDREKFSSNVTKIIKAHPNIEVISQKVTAIDVSKPTIIATGPLTDNELLTSLKKLIGENNSYFYDAMAPIVSKESVDMRFAFEGDRYDKSETAGDYVNAFLTKAEYEEFWNELTMAKTFPLKEFEDVKVFEGCMPIEIMAKKGIDTLRFGPLKPIGLKDKETKIQNYAIVQLRKENKEGTMLNMVGFQTNLLFAEQKRVFSLIPALKNAEFFKFGAMHRNTYINAPKVLNKFMQLKDYPNIFIAGQLSSVEGYVESFASGLIAAINMHRYLLKKEMIEVPRETMLGAIISYIANNDVGNYQPMNANFGVMPPLSGDFCDKKLKRQKIYERSMIKIDEYIGRII
ncbi:MAG: methylenetetrahydrofolate--tRNA-(uracil(54)-C(5))-methyltransferase (FADH(2)-oxidizing) TrmFO [Clostridia bacterium]